MFYVHFDVPLHPVEACGAVAYTLGFVPYFLGCLKEADAVRVLTAGCVGIDPRTPYMHDRWSRP